MNVRLLVRRGWVVVTVVVVAALAFTVARTLPASSANAQPLPPNVTVTAGPPTTAAATQPNSTVVVVNASADAKPDNTVAGATRLITDKFNHLTVDQIFDPDFWKLFVLDAIRWTVGFIPRLIVAAFLLLLFWIVYRVIRKLVNTSMRAAGVDESIRDMLGHLLKWAVLGFGLIIAGNQIGLEIAALLTGVSIIGLAVGFAAQESLSNFIAGIMIFLDKPFKVGDWIEIDGHHGQVRRVTFRSTRLTNLDGDVVVMPNLSMLSNKLINKSANPTTRVRVVVGIDYAASIERARGVLIGLTKGDPRVEPLPATRVEVVNLGASSVDLELRFWIREEQYENAMRYEFTERAKLALDAAGIGIPYPHVQLVRGEQSGARGEQNRI